MIFANFCASYKFICTERKRLLQTDFWKKAIFTVTKEFHQFFLVLSSMTNLREQFIGFHEVFDISCGYYFCNTKWRLKTKLFDRMAIFPLRKVYWPILAPTIKYDKPQETNYKGPGGIHTFVVQIEKSFF